MQYNKLDTVLPEAQAGAGIGQSVRGGVAGSVHEVGDAGEPMARLAAKAGVAMGEAYSSRWL